MHAIRVHATPSTPRAAAFELTIVFGAIVVAWQFSKWLLYPGLAIPDNAPYILRPITGFFAAWWLLRRRGDGWRNLGLRKPSSWPRMAAVAIGLYATDYAVTQWAVPAIAELLHPAQAPGFLGYVRGNTPAFLLWLTIGWVVGGFMEECLFRGYMTDRVAALLGNGVFAIAVAIVVQALLFGSMHLYQGAFGALNATLFALVHGVFYVLAGRNLWPLIVVHGLWNSVGIWGVYGS
jgi:membrane protease YdiL (CAAX protease family)